MASEPKNYPTLKEVKPLTLTPEENEANIRKIKDILILMGVHHLNSKGW